MNIFSTFSTQKTMRKKNEDELRTVLIASLIEDEENDDEKLTERDSSKVDYAITVVKEHETVIKIKKKVIINMGYKQGVLFKKFIQSDKFMEKMKEIGVSRPIVHFKMKLVEILENVRGQKTF